MVYFKDERVKQALLFFEFFVVIFVFEKWALAIFNLGFWLNLVNFGQFLGFVAIFGQKKWAIGHF